MELSTTTLKQIRSIVREEVTTQTNPIKQDVHSLKQDVHSLKQDISSHRQETKKGFKELKKNLKFSVNFLDKQDIAIEKRVSRLEISL